MHRLSACCEAGGLSPLLFLVRGDYLSRKCMAAAGKLQLHHTSHHLRQQTPSASASRAPESSGSLPSTPVKAMRTRKSSSFRTSSSCYHKISGIRHLHGHDVSLHAYGIYYDKLTGVTDTSCLHSSVCQCLGRLVGLLKMAATIGQE